MNLENWKFPASELVFKSGVLCLVRDEDEVEWCIGFRLHFEPLRIPGIDQRDLQGAMGDIEVHVDVGFKFSSLETVQNSRMPLGSPVEDSEDDLGSIYLFQRHNPVGWQEICFYDAVGESINMTFDLFFDFEYNGTPGGRVRQEFYLEGIKLEKRWEL